MASEAGGEGRSGIGVRLKAARERAGLTLLQAAERLRTDPASLEALEAENFERFGAAVYVRGHLRRYAELVGESPGELQELFATSTPVAVVEPDLTRIPKGNRPSDPRRILVPLMVLLVGIGIAGGVWFVLEGADKVMPSAGVVLEEPDPAPAAQSSVVAPAGAADDAEFRTTPVSETLTAPETVSAGGASVPSGSPPGAAAGPANGVPASQTAAPAPPANADAASTALRLHFAADSWVEVYDARGRQVYFGLGPANSTRRVEGAPPLRVLLGNAPRVSVEVDGRPMSLPDTVRRGRVAEFLIDRAGRVTPARLAANGE